ncbi:PREDICTED: protein AKNAD1 [Charadrius vociferus]|uniref:protein AKNAD1 n=1 Tax=Charadrius vociferus TaxID=50402 RepID=UPI000521B4AA|nr:PREDICTED: protein AKNAD1 [Charadrius vociferus]
MNSSFSEELGCVPNATDEEQDDLPYDGDIGITCRYNNSDNLNDCTCTEDICGILNLLACSENNKNLKATANYETYAQPEESSSHHRGAIGTTGIAVEMPGNEASFKKKLPVGDFSKPDSKEHETNSKMSNVLLRHFSKGELITTCQLIECETIPETSFTESINDTAHKPEPSEHVKGPLVHEQWATNFKEYQLEKHKKANIGDTNQNSLTGNRYVSKKPISPTVSLHELKYGQGQAHYCLPDFSKVASEIKIPERNDNTNSVPKTERTKSFPILSKSVIVNNILENKNHFNSAEVANQEGMSIPELLQQLEILPPSDFPNASIAIHSGDTGTSSEVFTLHDPIPIQSTHGLSKARLQCATTASALPAAGTVEAHCLNPSNLLPELTLGEKMSQILKDQTDQLIKKVEDFSKHMTQETFLLQDNYLALNQLKIYLDALERNYLTAREKHRNLQLQNYKDKSINVGEFDPERKVEGEIFRLGMLLEDIQEPTDDSKCNLSSLLTSYESAHPSYSLCEQRFFSLEGKYAVEGLASHHQGTLGQKFNADEESSDSEDISAYDSYDSQSEELMNYETESYKTFNTRLRGERKGLRCRCPRGSRDQFKLRNYKESVQSCALSRNKSSGSTSYSQKRISTQKAQKNKQPRELVNRLSERQNFEAAKTCYSSTYDKIILSHQYLPSKKSARSKSAINIRNRNANDSNANILNSTLDHAIQTANSLKKATERMVRAVSEDLAKVKRKQL